MHEGWQLLCCAMHCTVWVNLVITKASPEQMKSAFVVKCTPKLHPNQEQKTSSSEESTTSLTKRAQEKALRAPPRCLSGPSAKASRGCLHLFATEKRYALCLSRIQTERTRYQEFSRTGEKKIAPPTQLQKGHLLRETGSGRTVIRQCGSPWFFPRLGMMTVSFIEKQPASSVHGEKCEH